MSELETQLTSQGRIGTYLKQTPTFELEMRCELMDRSASGLPDEFRKGARCAQPYWPTIVARV